MYINVRGTEGQSRMDNPEKLATLGNQEWTIQRETGNIGYTRHRTKTNKTKNTRQYVLDNTIFKQTQIMYSMLIY
jgi:hypothetical protein